MKSWGRWLLWIVLSAIALQVFFVLRIVAMVVVEPQSTAFMRSEAWRVSGAGTLARWQYQWVDGAQISPHLKRAVIASEDAGFVDHGGVDWQAIESAWKKNERRQAVAEKRMAQMERRLANNPQVSAPAPKPVKIVGGSTITQQLAKNLFLSGERTLLRKGQELVLALALDAVLSKERILEIYLNSVEWGEGIFGAQAAAQHYFKKNAAQLSPGEAARLAVMLPSPKFFETRQGSRYLARRTRTIAADLSAARVP